MAMVSCKEEAATLFTKLDPKSTGIYFKNNNSENEDYNVFVYEYFYNGGGVALGDINNDGLVDIYFSSNQGANRLYLNKGNLKFEDITERSGTAATEGWKTGVAMADVNGDGLLDIYICRSAANEPNFRRNSLLINNGDLTFEDKAKEYGLDDNSYSTHAAFFDYDRDGDLDMFLLNHAVSRIVRNYDIRTERKTERVPFVGNALYRNDNGKFVDVSDSAKVYGPAHNYGLGLCFSDVNGDGWIDIYTSNDYTGSDHLLINVDGKYFIESELDLLTHISRFSMGADIADINNDGYPDIYSLDMLPDNNERQKALMWGDNFDIYSEMVRNGLHHQFMRNMLHLNNGSGKFSEIGQFAGISNTDWSWAALFADYDNDGWQDLFVTNGYKRDYTNNDFAKYRAHQLQLKNSGGKADSYTTMLEKMPSTKIHNYLFQNLGGYRFHDKSMEWGLGELTLTHGAAWADLDNDGDLDLVTNNMDDFAGIYRNNSEKSTNNNFLKIRLEGNAGNNFGLGAKAVLYKDGRVMMMRELSPFRGFQSSVEPSLHFGIGKETSIDSLVLRWPDGTIQKVDNVQVNRTITLQQRNAERPQDANPVKHQTYFSLQDDGIGFKHTENKFVDFKVQSLLTRMYSAEGPAMTSGDVNGDGLNDYFLGGARGQSGELFLKNKNGTFTAKSIAALIADAASEDVDAVFFDCDGDGDLDLYVVSGGYEFNEKDPLLQDRLYKNDGKGNFTKAKLPSFFSSGSCVRPYDIDNDGDIDLFVGGRIVPGKYPYAPESFILLNNGRGEFELADIPAELRSGGMVTDAAWVDVNGDRVKDLVVVGEWMPVSIYINERGRLTNATSTYIKENTNGFWNCILVSDFDQDGDEDFIVGNYGLNSQFRASADKPISMYYDDFDNNGSVDPLVFHYIQEGSFPFATRDELTDQLPMMKKKFPAYKDYVHATLEAILSPVQIQQASVLHAYTMKTTYFRNDRGSLTSVALPEEIQFAPIFGMAVMDVNGDGYADLITGGNMERTRARTGLLKGNNGFVFLGDGKGGFRFIRPDDSGINITEDVRKIIVDGTRVFLAINNGNVRTYQVNEHSVHHPPR